MSAHTIHLRSESPSLLVEFDLPPGTHARIGAGADAEVSIPLAGLADYACTIGRTMEGRLYLADPEGNGMRYISLPAALPLPPYQFVVFRPVETAAPLPEDGDGGHSRKTPLKTILSAAAVCVALGAAAGLVVWDMGKRSAESQRRKEAAVAPVAAAPIQETAPRDDTPAADPVRPAAGLVKEAAAVTQTPLPPPVVNTAPPAAPKFDLEALVKRVAPAVFKLEVKTADGVVVGTGTAFAISADGLAVTNYHVVEHGEFFAARTAQGAEFTVLGVKAVDPFADLALISIKGNNMPFLEIGESDRLNVGTPVVTYGSPQGLSGTLSEGIVSARRDEPEIMGYAMPNGGHVLQITAPISPGSSGSPVIDHGGKVIGVAVVASVSSSAQSLNFAVPVEAVRKLRRDSDLGLAEIRKSASARPTRTTPAGSGPNEAFAADPDRLEFDRLWSDKNWWGCVRVCRSLLARHPASSDAHNALGLSLMAAGAFPEAETYLRSTVKMDPEDDTSWAALGFVLNSQKKVREARESWRRATSLSPDSVWAWEQLSYSYLVSGEYVEAVAPLERLRKLDRVAFERLLAALRMLRYQTAETKAVLSHFDKLTDGGAPLAGDVKRLVETLIVTLLLDGDGPNLEREIGNYASTVNPYHKKGAQSRTAVLNDLAAFRKKWPLRYYRLLRVESAKSDRPDTIEATFRYEYVNSDVKTTESGTFYQGIRFTLTAGRWLVSGIQTIEQAAD